MENRGSFSEQCSHICKPKHRRKPKAKKVRNYVTFRVPRGICTSHVTFKRHIQRHIFRKQKDTFNMNFKALEAQLMELAEEMGGKPTEFLVREDIPSRTAL